MRYYLIDRVTALTPGESARGIKCATLTDEILHDHFPDFPMLPGALIVEAAAQLSGFLLEMTFNAAGSPVVRAVLAQIQRAKFHQPVGPGDRMEIVATITGMRESSAQVDFEAQVDGREAARGTLTFVMRSIDSPRVHEQRRRIYAVWTREMSPPLVLP
jgi:3-hydroxymyristoyl/3-hydroxydecanoyl-(acyl carrier protein) dehydratases